MNLITFPTINITAYDSTSATSTSASLTTSTQEGTLSNFVLGTALTNANGKVLTAGDTTDIFYLPFTATDISGNPTSNYNLIVNGVVTNTSTSGLKNCITSTDTDVTAQIVKDPNNSNNAVIQVTDNGNNVPQDMPLVLSAMTYTAKTSSLNVTLKREAELSKFTLQAPSTEVAENDASAIIPFTAADQDGNVITAYSSIVGKVTLSSNATLIDNADGTASVQLNGPFTSTGNQMVTATCTGASTDGYSSVNINVQNNAVANALTLSSTILINSMQPGATQAVDFGYNKGGLTVADQYDRTMNMTGAPGTYEVVPSTSNSNVVSVSGIAAGGTGITVTGGITGSATVTFNLINTTAPNTIIDSKSEIISVVDGTNITGYTIGAVTSPIYVGTITAADGTSAQQTGDDYFANPVVYGTTSNGTKIALGTTTKSSVTGVSSNTIVAANVDNTTNFKLEGDVDPSDIYVGATTTTNNATTASTNLNVTINGADGHIHQLSTPITSSTATPVASSVGVNVATQNAGVSLDSTGTNVTVNLSTANLANIGLTAGSYLTKFTPSGAATKQVIYLAPNDQYGESDTNLSSLTQTSVSPAGQFSVSSTGLISGTPVSGQTVTLTGAAGAYSKTINITFTGTAPVVTPTAVVLGSGSVTGAVAGDTKITGLTANTAYNVSVGGATATSKTTDATGAITGLIDGDTYTVTAIAAPTAVILGSGSVTGAVAGDKTITGLTANTAYNVSLGGATATSMTTDATGAITGLIDGDTYTVTAIVAPAAGTLNGTVGAQDIFGNYYATITVPDSSKVTAVTDQGTALVLGDTYSAPTATTIKVPVTSNADVVTVTIGGVVNTVVLK